MSVRVVGLDLSLAASGVARWDAGARPQLDTIRADRLVDLWRLQAIRWEVTRLTRGADLVVVEGLQPAGATKAGAYANERAGLYWLVLDRLDKLRIPVAVVPSALLKMYALGVGGGKNATKMAVGAAVVRRYDVDPGDDNQADACVLAAMGLHALEFPPAPVPATHVRALAKVRWPAVDAPPDLASV